MTKRGTLVVLIVFLASAVCLAQSNPSIGTSPAATPDSGPQDSPSAGPRVNDTPGTARVLVPDGTSVSDAQGATAGVYFTAKLEQGKTYALEILDANGDLHSNCVNGTVYDSDGVTTPPANTDVGRADNVAPAMNVSDDGERHLIRPFIGNTFPLVRTYVFKVTQCTTGDSFRIRLRESTVYSRWSVNGYDMYVALHNTTTTATSIQNIYYDDTGANGVATGHPVTVDNVTVPAMGAFQVLHPSGSLAPNHGALRVHWSGLGTGPTPGSINVQTYAYNPAAGTYLLVLPERVNDGRTSNSW